MHTCINVYELVYDCMGMVFKISSIKHKLSYNLTASASYLSQCEIIKLIAIKILTTEAGPKFNSMWRAHSYAIATRNELKNDRISIYATGPSSLMRERKSQFHCHFVIVHTQFIKTKFKYVEIKPKDRNLISIIDKIYTNYSKIVEDFSKLLLSLYLYILMSFNNL